MPVSYGQRLLDERDLYAERNSELHVLCHELLGELERLGHEGIHEYRKRLHDVPQSRIPADAARFPMRRGY